MKAFLSKWILGENPDTPKDRARIGKLSGAVGIVCNLLLFLGKLAVGMLAGSVSITADAMNNLSDASSSIVTLLGFRLAEKPADADHPYGHARFEYLSGLAVSAMIIVIGFELAKSSVGKILSPAAVAFSIPTAAVLLLSILIKLGLAAFNRTLGQRIQSTALIAAGTDSRNDVIATAAVLAATVIEHLTQWHVDGWMGLAVALFILWSGADLAKQTISPLLGEAADPQLRMLIADTVGSHPKVLGFHDLMVHDYGPGQRFASMHVEMDHKEDPMVCHDIIDDIERQCLLEHNVHLVIHYDPVVTGDAALAQMQNTVQQILSRFDPQLSLHDFRMVQGVGHTNLIFDVVLPDSLSDKKRDIKAHLDSNLAQLDGNTYYTVITFDPAAFNQN